DDGCIRRLRFRLRPGPLGVQSRGPEARADTSALVRSDRCPKRVTFKAADTEVAVTAEAKTCTCGRPMRVELSGRAVGGKGEHVVLWVCDACGHAEHEVRPA